MIAAKIGCGCGIKEWPKNHPLLQAYTFHAYEVHTSDHIPQTAETTRNEIQFMDGYE